MYAELQEAAEYIRQHTGGFLPAAGIVLGTGLGGLVKEMEVQYSLEYGDIPHFPLSTVESHKGRLLLGMLSGKPVIAMQGRFHHYEGYSMQQIVFPVRVMKLLGIKNLIVSNACGALNPDIKKGSLMLIRSHINLLPTNPLTGTNIPELGPRFPDMSNAYDKTLLKKAEQVAARLQIPVHKGVYAVVSGPNLETDAEYRFLRIIGGDVVGMSTVPEVIAAAHMGLPTFAISVITDEGWTEELMPVSIEEVIAAASEAEPKMTAIIKNLIAEI